jgi:hypothetical protein
MDQLVFVSGTTIDISRQDKAAAMEPMSPEAHRFFISFERRLRAGDPITGSAALEYTGLLLDLLSTWADAPVARTIAA